ncbi:MAG: phosphoribosylglycinamide formyltransferase [Campylobacteraceae bacterium]|jgi:phosphoribosylglycinamide formyltransferase-1|nr:phosphoribosylglycinamide formyltransferase [Campylobacteraceae bacterium]
MVTKKIAVLFSGSGTNLENLFIKLHRKVFNGVKIEIALSICNNEDAGGISKSLKYGVTPVVLKHKDFASRGDFDKKLVEVIKKADIDLCVLAGFMRILTPYFTKNVRAINIHPSLLPLFKGADAMHQSYAANVKKAGASVHFVNEELDGGEVIAQKSFMRTIDMSYEEYEANIHEIEYEILPNAVIGLLTNSNFVSKS